MLSINDSSSSVSLSTLLLMLTVVLLSLFEAGFDNNVVHLVLIPLGLYLIVLVVKNRLPVDLSIQSPLIWFTLFLLWAGISIFWSINPHRTLVEFIQISLYGIVFLLTATLKEENVITLGRIALITATAVALFGISQFMLISSSRLISTFSNPNPLGIFMVMIFLVTWGYCIREKTKYVHYLCFIILVALFLTGSRGAIICFILAIPFIFYGLKKEILIDSLKKTFIYVLLAVIVAQLLIYVAPFLQKATGHHFLITQFLTRSETFLPFSVLGRLSNWLTGVDIALSKPFNGYGLGTFYLSYFIEYDGGIWYSRFAHSHYVQTMAELGIIGLGLFFGFLLTYGIIIVQTIKGNKYPIIFPGLVAASIAFIINIGGEFNWNFPAVAVTFMMIAGSVLGVSDTKNNYIKPVNKLIFIILLSIIVALTTWQAAAHILYARGIKHEFEGNVEKAVETYDKANAIYSINSMSHVFAGNSYYSLYKEMNDHNMLNKSLNRYQKAIKLSPYDANIHNSLAWLYWELGEIEDARFHFVKGTDLAAYRLKMFIDLAYFYIEQKHFKEAEEVVRRGLILENAVFESSITHEDLEKVKDEILMLKHFLQIVEQQ